MNAIIRTFTLPLLAIAMQPVFAAQPEQITQPTSSIASARTASTITTADGVQLYYKDWGPKDGPVVTFSHGWPLNSDSWESQMLFLASEGYRVVAHDRRGHGRSS
ncbi:MAG: alpha/beta fold hydrolase, partial [Gammaproteobacteria bacterium]|nr:alpha/beta fold hydrolase [Gammaproteobacteria bacterium]